jgi:hypothetical protein
MKSLEKLLKDYELTKFNLNDSVGEFTYKVRLSNHIDYEPSTGFLYCKDAVLGNVGVQIYKGYELGFADKNAIVKVHRKAEDIFDSKSLESLRGKPITLDHPQGLVDSKNARTLAKGAILDVGRVEDKNIVCDIVIYDHDLIDLVAPEGDDGVRRLSDSFRDLSLGYSAKLVPIDDTNEYKQEDIEYNHLAVVKEGRASNAMIRDSENKEIKEGRKSMGLFNLFKGKKMQVLDEENGIVKFLDEDEIKQEDLKDEEVDKDKDKEVKKEEVKDEQEVDKDKEKKEEKKEMVKDKAYFNQAFNDAKALPDGPFKEDTIQELNKEYLELFPRKEVKDSKKEDGVVIKVQDSKEIDELAKKEFKDETPKAEVDFDFIEKETREYYDKLTNPESGQHESHEAWQKFYNSEVRKGKTNLNL